MARQDAGHLAERVALGVMDRCGGHADPDAVGDCEDNALWVEGGSLDTGSEVLLERVEVAALGYVGRARLVQLVERAPVLGRIADIAQGREVDPGLATRLEVRQELGVVEHVQVELEPDPVNGHEHTPKKRGSSTSGTCLALLVSQNVRHVVRRLTRVVAGDAWPGGAVDGEGDLP